MVKGLGHREKYVYMQGDISCPHCNSISIKNIGEIHFSDGQKSTTHQCENCAAVFTFSYKGGLEQLIKEAGDATITLNNSSNVTATMNSVNTSGSIRLDQQDSNKLDNINSRLYEVSSGISNLQYSVDTLVDVIKSLIEENKKLNQEVKNNYKTDVLNFNLE